MLVQGSLNLGRDFGAARHHRARMVDTGFVNVEEKLFKWPTNPWPKDKDHKEVGLWTLANIGGGLEGICMGLMTRGLGLSREEVIAYTAAARKDLRNPRIHAYWPMYVPSRAMCLGCP